jgi:glycosyltransferase involved in cell wall biosynthesis/nucleotide-binding universal stress UspA family protein
MSDQYKVLLALHHDHRLEMWCEVARQITPEHGEIHLRGMVTVPTEYSLSEGARAARQWRESFQQIAVTDETIHDRVHIHVEYEPMRRILDDVGELAIDLLVVQWAGFVELTGGLSTDEILKIVPCDLVLIGGNWQPQEGPILLSLRGAPNITLGLHVAKALAGRSSITIYHAADRERTVPDLEALMRSDPQIQRTVTTVSGITEGILREAQNHKSIVLGARLHSEPRSSTSGPVIQQLAAQTDIPLVLVRAKRPESFGFHFPRPLNAQAEENLSTHVDRWFAKNTFHSDEFADLRYLMALKEKQAVSISIGLPALNEEKTIGNVIQTLKSTLMDEIPLIDEIVVIDSRSTDRTVQIAQDLGIPTYIHHEVLTDHGAITGKGEALWKSLYLLQGDIIAWVDTDITNIHPRFIYGLLGPLLKHPHIQYVKGFYQRPIAVDDKLQGVGGGRVTELVARPILNLFYPELSGIIQPLSGEYAGRRAALEQVPFFSGYGVETGLLIDLFDKFGLDALAQTDLEVRIHHNQPLLGLSKMSFAILQVFIARLEKRYGMQMLDKANRSMKTIIYEPERFGLEINYIEDVERPPMLTVSDYINRSIFLPR